MRFRPWLALAGACSLLLPSCSSDNAGRRPAGNDTFDASLGERDAGWDAGATADAGHPRPHHDAGSDAGAPAPEGLTFPDSFVFGTSIAGFQVDMGCPTLPASVCDDPHSDWYVFTTNADLIKDSSTHLSGQNPSQVGPGFWEVYKDDIRRTDEELHNQGLRFSIEWSRIFPTPTDDAQTPEEVAALANRENVARYHQILAELKARGMRPLVTLYHYSLPDWIHDAVGCHKDLGACTNKGWVDAERTLREIRKYTAFCAREFGGEIDWWATLNEPLQNMMFGYVQPSDERTHPPAVSLKVTEAHVVFNALIDAHARMYDEIKANDTVDADGDGKPSFVGVVYPLVPITPRQMNDADQTAADNIDYLWNRAFLNAVALGSFDEKLDKNVVTRDDLTNRMDYVGVNYYFGLQVSNFVLPIPIITQLSPLFVANPLDFQETPNRPEELKGFLHWINTDLHVPAVVTENGTPDPSDDGSTPRFLLANLKAVQEAITEGADVRGYFYWTLMDNYEWNHGMDVRMGLYAVDKNDPTKKRVARKAVPLYGVISKHHVLPFAELMKYGLR